ncbi:hypothetical protein [uncultured Fibrobacter sp.]|uniref:hypothetical protein n=1 Tax=uncultured Fibrobacter sp. TaxID=261512 RepID=UPI0025D2C5CC|nr:hypothetical protein [uncultured Fibrobacter sp.]
MKKLLLAFVLGLCSAALAQSPTDSSFSHIYVSVEGGEQYPFGDLVDAVENSFYGGFGFRYTYTENIDGFVLMDYSYIKPVPRGLKIYGAHQVSGKLGLDFKWKAIAPLAIGAGFVCDWVRGDYDDDKIDETSFNKDLGGTLTDNETEFGWFARVNLPLIRRETYRVGFNALWKELWTLPKRSEMLSMGVYFERRIW